MTDKGIEYSDPKDIEWIEIECMECVLIDEWPCDLSYQQSPKVGALIIRGKCPHCGSTRGKIIESSFWPSDEDVWSSWRED